MRFTSIHLQVTESDYAAAISGERIARSMRAAGVTIRGLADSMQITQKRVREVRARGVVGPHMVADWIEGIETAATRQEVLS